MAYRWVILGVGILAYATSQFARQNYAGVQKFMAEELALDKAALGLLGSVFFYSYALFQMPWGLASDRFGSRIVTGLGILITAAAMWGFATGETQGALLFWRVVSGVGGAAVYVAMVGGMARWFPKSERGFSQSALGGVGGGLGESAAYFLMPLISIYMTSGWRQATSSMAIALTVIGVVCLILLRSDPPTPIDEVKAPDGPFDWSLLRDPLLWCYTFLFSAFIIAIRVIQPWIAVYAADVYIARYGMDVNAAVMGAGTLVIVAYSLLGRAFGCPLAGKLSDILLRRGISRPAVAIGWLVLAVVLLQMLSAELSTTWGLAVVSVLLGTSVNLFTLIAAAVSETYGAKKAASIVSFVNMVAQVSGATALAASGYVGISMSTQVGQGLSEYRGIWLTAMVAVGIYTAIGATMHLALAGRWLTARPRPIEQTE
jgi:sugar phosphate permease